MNKYFLVFSLFLSLFISFGASCADWAVVVSPRAVIYADSQMSASIGYIKKGKKIRVGEKARNSGKVLPIIVSKRVAYIRVADIAVSSQEEIVEKVSSNLSREINLSDQRSLIGLGPSFTMASVSFKEAPTPDKQYNLNLIGFNLRVLQTGRTSRYGLRGTLGYKFGERERESFKIFNLDFDFYYKIFHSNFFDFNINAGLSLIPFAEYSLESNFALRGFGAGGQASLEGVFKFEKFAIQLSAFYQYQQLLGFELPENSLFPDEFEPSFLSVGGAGFVSFYY